MGRRTKPLAPANTGEVYLVPQSVDQITNIAASQLEDLANQLVENANGAATKLRELAGAVREHGRIATENVTAHCGKIKHIMDTAHRLAAQLEGEEPIDEVEHLPVAPQLEANDYRGEEG